MAGPPGHHQRADHRRAALAEHAVAMKPPRTGVK